MYLCLAVAKGIMITAPCFLIFSAYFAFSLHVAANVHARSSNGSFIGDFANHGNPRDATREIKDTLDETTTLDTEPSVTENINSRNHDWTRHRVLHNVISTSSSPVSIYDVSSDGKKDARHGSLQNVISTSPASIHDGSSDDKENARHRVLQNVISASPASKEDARHRVTITSPISSHSDNEECGDGMCRCHGNLADCSKRAGGMPYIPTLPQNVTALNITYDSITHIPGDYFTNVTGFRMVSLGGNNLQYISPDAFKGFHALYTVFIDLNITPLQYDTLLPVVNTTSIEKLSIRQSGLGPLPPGFFNNLPNLRELILYDNFLGDVSSSEFQGLRNLISLGLANNRISRFTMTGALHKLVSLNLNTNQLFGFPETCNSTTHNPLFPKLTHLLLRKNLIATVPEKVCLPKLKVLLLSENVFTVIKPDSFGSSRFPKLVELYLSSMNSRLFNFSAYAFNNTSLERVTLIYNSIMFYKDPVDVAMFANCPKLSDLQLSHNYISDISEERFLQLFGHLDLQYLYMERCQLSNITRQMLAPFRNLEVLRLSENRLANLADGMFDDLGKLKDLVLDTNQISVVGPNLFSSDLQNGLRKLDLSGNPFDCSCSVLWFQTWLKAKHSLFYPAWTRYKCFNLPDLDLEDFVLNQQACLFSHITYVLIVVLGSLAIITYTCVLLAYRYRWHLRLVLYEAFRGRGDVRRRHLETGDFDYDVFVSFDSEDDQWVRTHLMPQLEGRLGFKLCIHQRDFILGKYIVDNIADCVDKSKKIMMVFSTNFAHSHWCQFELAMCLRHVMDHDDDLLIVCLDDMSSRDMTSSMMAVLKTTTYIQWEENNQDAVEAFWGRLEIALEEIAVPRQRGRIN